MERSMLKLFFFALILSLVAGEGNDDTVFMRQLRKDILDRNRYDSYSRPVKNHLTTTNISFYFVLDQVSDLDIKTETLSFDGFIILKWTDEHLTWSPEAYGGIEKVHAAYWEIWLPELYLWNQANGASWYTFFDSQSLVIDYNGTVKWAPSASYTSFCPLDLTSFPFDKQYCKIYFSTWSYQAEHINFTTPVNRTCGTGPYFVNQEWAVKFKGCEKMDDQSKYSIIEIEIELTRQLGSYTYYVFLPYLLASTLAITSFFLPIASNKRLIFASLSLFILIILILFLGSFLGFHSLGVPYAIKCISMNILLLVISICLSSIITNVLNHLSSFSIILPSAVINVILNPIFIKIFFLSTENVDDDENIDNENDDKNLTHVTTSGSNESASVSAFAEPKVNQALKKEWIIIIKFVDRLLLIIYTITVIVYHT